jgi:molybdenum cofactor cytidylyltransferase
MSIKAHERVIAIVLAAGRASRFGRLKQIEPVAHTCLLGITIENALQSEEIERVVLVLGAGAETVKSTLADMIEDERIDIVINRDHERGLSTSLRAGLERARSRGCDAAVFLLGDMPMIDTVIIDSVISHYRASDTELCYAKSSGHAGHPIAVGKKLFEEFMNIEGDIGGREIVRKHIGSALGVVVNNEGINHQLDINTPKDMDAYLSLRRKRGGRQSAPRTASKGSARIIEQPGE